MNYKNLIKIALKALANNKFRGFLTMLGIIIGVASVIAMLAIGQGSKRSIREQISEMGSNMIMVHPGNGRFGGVRQSASSMQTLKLEDYRTIEREASYISACSPTVNSSGQAIYGANNAPTTLYGVNGDRSIAPFKPLFLSSLEGGRASDGTRGTNKRRREEPHRAVSVLQ